MFRGTSATLSAWKVVVKVFINVLLFVDIMIVVIRFMMFYFMI